MGSITLNVVGLLIGTSLGALITCVFYAIWKRSLFYLGLVILFLMATDSGLIGSWSYWLRSLGGIGGIVIGYGLCGAYLSRLMNPDRSEFLGISYWKNYIVLILLSYASVMLLSRIELDIGLDKTWSIAILINFAIYAVRAMSIQWIRYISLSLSILVAIEYGFQCIWGSPWIIDDKDFALMNTYLWIILGSVLIPRRQEETEI